MIVSSFGRYVAQTAHDHGFFSVSVRL